MGLERYRSMPPAGCERFTRDFTLSLHVTCLKKVPCQKKKTKQKTRSICFVPILWLEKLRWQDCQLVSFTSTKEISTKSQAENVIFLWKHLLDLICKMDVFFCTLAKTQLHAQLHRQICGNIFIRVIYSKQQVQIETEKVCLHTAMWLVEQQMVWYRTYRRQKSVHQQSLPISVFVASTYLVTPIH